jgi:hypothetical protein
MPWLRLLDSQVLEIDFGPLLTHQKLCFQARKKIGELLGSAWSQAKQGTNKRACAILPWHRLLVSQVLEIYFGPILAH